MLCYVYFDRWSEKLGVASVVPVTWDFFIAARCEFITNQMKRAELLSPLLILEGFL